MFEMVNEYAPDAGADDAESAEPVSEALTRLRAMIKHRSAANADLEAVRLAIARLEGAAHLEAAPIAALARLNAADDAAMRAWSDAGDDAEPMPTPDAEGRISYDQLSKDGLEQASTS
jgi:hypothetical protein